MLRLEMGDYMFTFDLKSGYHHVDICPVQHTYLGFAWLNVELSFKREDKSRAEGGYKKRIGRMEVPALS